MDKRARPRGAPPPPRDGADLHARVQLTLEEAMRGGRHRLRLRSPQWNARGQVELVCRTLDVTLPAGLRPGRLLCLPGLGEPGRDRGRPGDLYLEICVRRHPRYLVHGADLHAELPLAPWEAALGATVALELPDGRRVAVPVPADTPNGARFVLEGQGMPGPAPGALELLARIVLPSSADARARRLYQAMASELADFDPRA